MSILNNGNILKFIELLDRSNKISLTIFLLTLTLIINTECNLFVKMSLNNFFYKVSFTMMMFSGILLFLNTISNAWNHYSKFNKRKQKDKKKQIIKNNLFVGLTECQKYILAYLALEPTDYMNSKYLFDKLKNRKDEKINELFFYSQINKMIKAQLLIENDSINNGHLIKLNPEYISEISDYFGN